MSVQDIMAKHIEGLENKLFYGTSTKPEVPESVLTVEILNGLFAKLEKPRDDKIFVVDKGYWPHHFLILTKDNGKHFMLNQEGYCDFKAHCEAGTYVQVGEQGAIKIGGVDIIYIDAEKAAEIICEHCAHPNGKEIANALSK